jgi:hypothetical protein
MAPAHALPTGLGIEHEGLELPLDQLPPWEESKLKILPAVSGMTFMIGYLLISCEVVEESQDGRAILPGPPMRCHGTAC